MNNSEKQLKYSIRKVSVGAASVVIGALYLLMGAGIAHADGMESAREAERTANPTDAEQSGNGETGNKADLSNTDATASTYSAPICDTGIPVIRSTDSATSLTLAVTFISSVWFSIFFSNSAMRVL